MLIGMTIEPEGDAHPSDEGGIVLANQDHGSLSQLAEIVREIPKPHKVRKRSRAASPLSNKNSAGRDARDAGREIEDPAVSLVSRSTGRAGAREICLKHQINSDRLARAKDGVSC
jgi:hypothetical protein